MKESDHLTKDNGPKISNSLLALLVGISFFIVIVFLIVALTSNVTWIFITVIILFILLVITKVVAMIILKNEKR
ncbi:hypothetical protein [Methanobacterium sp.]|uniref:hypothetical protein n=1 Tax=Methanobacterium sp. TaxID=2164 RepID=UPI003C789FB4